MIRNDFVSNSSSCSFFVWIKTKKDLNELKKIWPEVKRMTQNYISVYPKGIEYAVNHPYDGEYIATGYLDKDDWKLIDPGDAIRVCSGDDHYEGFEDELEKLYDLFSANYKFKVFCDREAHYTKGEYYEDYVRRSSKQKNS